MEIKAIQVPLHPRAQDANRPRYVETRLERIEGEMLAALQDGLMHQGARLDSGAHVTTAAQAVRWLLQQLGGTNAQEGE